MSDKTIYDVLAEVQDAIEQPKLNAVVDYADRSGKRTHFQYADLGELWRVIRSACKGKGLYVRHAIRRDESGQTWMAVVAAHGGTEIELASVPANLIGKPQEVGSAITYAKRYSLAMAFGLAAEEDDDGQRGSGQEVKAAKPTAERIESGIKALMGVSPLTREMIAEQLARIEGGDAKLAWLASQYSSAKAQMQEG